MARKLDLKIGDVYGRLTLETINFENTKQGFKGLWKCDCGNNKKDHYKNEGYCHHSQHPNAGKCGCTWFYPNVEYIKKTTKEKEWTLR